MHKLCGTLFQFSFLEKRWVNKNVDFKLLATQVGNFFKEKDFEAIKGETPTGYQILAENSPCFRLDGYVTVTIEGKPDDFLVKVELCRNGKKHSFAPIIFTTMFLGGYFILRGKSDEHWMTFEKEFWRYVDNVMLYLNNSAQDSGSLSK